MGYEFKDTNNTDLNEINCKYLFNKVFEKLNESIDALDFTSKESIEIVGVVIEAIKKLREVEKLE